MKQREKSYLPGEPEFLLSEPPVESATPFSAFSTFLLCWDYQIPTPSDASFNEKENFTLYSSPIKKCFNKRKGKKP